MRANGIYHFLTLTPRVWCEGDAEFLRSKLHTAEFFFQRILPRAAMHAKTMGANTESVMAMPNSYFDAS